MIKQSTIILFLALLNTASLSADPFVLLSPDNKTVKAEVTIKEGTPLWTLTYDGINIIKESLLGITPEPAFQGGFTAIGNKNEHYDQYWEPVWGKFSRIRNNYNETVWSLKERNGQQRKLDIVFRVYNNGIAFRYKLHGTGNAVIKDDATHFNFADDYTCWSANGERANIGPVELSKYKGHQMPLTIRIDDTHYCSMLEAAIYTYAPLQIKKAGPTSIRTQFAESTVTLPSETSWRVLILGRTPGDLLTSSIPVNLNPPCRIKETDWIKPGLAMWDWRAWGAKTADGFQYNLDMASWRRMIDFASKHGIRYLVLDANWYGHEFNKKSNPMTSRDYLVYQPKPDSPRLASKPAPPDWKDPIDVPALIKYGKQKNVGIILYINDVARHNFDFEKTLATYHKWGAAGIKYGFMKGKRQKKVLDTREIVKLCAKYKLYCDFHDGPIPPSGDRRTYPNYLTREFCHSQCDATRSFSPKTFCTTVFCNMVAGPLDMCNGFFTLNGLEKERPKVFRPVNSTVVAEAARVLITFSGLSILPDTPESYEKKADLFTFIAGLPMTWDETKILNSSIGHFITTARRHGKRWYIASCCDEKGANLNINLDFLEKNTQYKATLYEDTPQTHYEKNKEAYRIREKTVRKGDVISADLAPGGGHCILLTPIP